MLYIAANHHLHSVLQRVSKLQKKCLIVFIRILTSIYYNYNYSKIDVKSILNQQFINMVSLFSDPET